MCGGRGAARAPRRARTYVPDRARGTASGPPPGPFSPPLAAATSPGAGRPLRRRSTTSARRDPYTSGDPTDAGRAPIYIPRAPHFPTPMSAPPLPRLQRHHAGRRARARRHAGRFFREHFGNASSEHAPGWAADEAVTKAREQTARVIGATPRTITFTSGATESISLAIRGAGAVYGGAPPPDRDRGHRAQGGAQDVRGDGARGLRDHLPPPSTATGSWTRRPSRRPWTRRRSSCR